MPKFEVGLGVAFPDYHWQREAVTVEVPSEELAEDFAIVEAMAKYDNWGITTEGFFLRYINEIFPER